VLEERQRSTRDSVMLERISTSSAKAVKSTACLGPERWGSEHPNQEDSGGVF